MITENAILLKHFEKHGFDDSFFESYEAIAVDDMQYVNDLLVALYNIKHDGLKIVIYTDFDVDGIMTSVVAYAGLSELGFNVELFHPTPADGYGFRPKDVDDILNYHSNVSVILTGDVGIGCNEAIAYAQDKGLTVLVTDHHVGTEPCIANVVVNPNQLGETYSHNGICGAYVMYKLLERYACLFCDKDAQTAIERLQLFAGVATISDIMPLVYENRQLVRTSVALMQQLFEHNDSMMAAISATRSAEYKQAFVGTHMLLKYFADIRKIKTVSDIDEQFYGFYLVPFLNSAKRMNGDMRGIYDIFFNKYVSPVDGFPNMSCVENGIKYIEILNDRRRELIAEYYERLTAERIAGETSDSVFMEHGVYITDATCGLLGLLASKFQNETGLPVFVVNKNEDGSYNGSGRNPGWFDLSTALAAYGLNIVCSGHKEAFGVFIPDHDALVRYLDFYNDVVLPAQVMASLDAVDDTRVSIAYNNCVDSDFVSDMALIQDYMNEADKFHPYGKAFPEPLFVYHVPLSSVDEQIFGAEKQHVKLKISNKFEILLFNMALDFERLKREHASSDLIISCEGRFRYNIFGGKKTVNFLASDISVA